jgi:hypothetical protein
MDTTRKIINYSTAPTSSSPSSSQPCKTVRLSNDNEKTINISGTNNKYQLNKLTNASAKKTVNKRVECNKWFIQPDLLTHSVQLQIIQDNNNTENASFDNYLLMKQQIEHKIYGYKQQDIKKHMHDASAFVTFEHTLTLLNDSHLLCAYCDTPVLILYENVREPSQWSLDRINNDLGHNCGNLLIACLSCNLKRRRTNMNAFMFTKQMKLIKS